MVVIVVHVDDLLVSANNNEGIERFMRETNRLFAIKVLGEASFHMGRRYREKYEIWIHQHLFSETFAGKYNVDTMNELPALFGRQSVLPKGDGPQSLEEL